MGYPYQGQNKDELSLKVGQVVTILSKDVEDAGWWKGELNGAVGVFPENFVKEIIRKKPERPPQPVGMTKMKQEDDLEKSKKLSRTVSVEEKYDLGSLRKELEESTVSKGEPQEKSQSKANPPAINISSASKYEKDNLTDFEAMNSQSKLSHTTAGRAKPPKRRPPSQHFLKENIPDEIIIEAEEDEVKDEPEDKKKMGHGLQIKMLDISQVKLRDASKPFKSSTGIRTSSPKTDEKPVWLAELTKKQGTRNSSDATEDSKNNNTPSEEKTETAVSSKYSTSTKQYQDNDNLGWNRNILTSTNSQDSNRDLSEAKHLRSVIDQMKEEMQKDIDQLKKEIEEEKKARLKLEKEVQILKEKFAP